MIVVLLNCLPDLEEDGGEGELVEVDGVARVVYRLFRPPLPLSYN